jgi:hypothetical protein
MLAIACAAVALVGAFWFLKPQDSLLMPAGLIFDQPVARRSGFSESESDRILRAYGAPDPWNLVRARLFGFSFLSLGVAAYFAHISLSMLLAEICCAVYCFVIVSVLARRQIGSGTAAAEEEKNVKHRRITDRVLVATLLVASGNAVFLALIPSLQARIVALVVFAVVPVAWYIWHARMLDVDETPLRVALEWRQKSGWSATIIGFANAIAYAYGTLLLDNHDPVTIALRVWSMLGVGATFYSRDTCSCPQTASYGPQFSSVTGARRLRFHCAHCTPGALARACEERVLPKLRLFARSPPAQEPPP